MWIYLAFTLMLFGIDFGISIVRNKRPFYTILSIIFVVAQVVLNLTGDMILFILTGLVYMLYIGIKIALKK